MIQNKICLASDNWSPAHPAIIEAVVQANQGYTKAYGLDIYTEKAQDLIQNTFQNDCKIVLLPTGTGANVLALKLACKSYESIICSNIAHIYTQEAGAIEAISGCKLLPVFHTAGKISPEAIRKKLSRERAFGKHSTSPKVLSITQPTEVGTIYSLKELQALSQLCKEENLFFHMDGSRIYNAAVGLQVGLHKITQVDILSLGGTKNGLLGAEALLIFNSELQQGSDHLQKQSLLLLSKMRYLSAQFIPFFEQKLWHELAYQANQKAKEVAAIIKAAPQLFLSYPVESNQIFFTAPDKWISHIQDKVHCYLWDEEKKEIRFVFSWNTSEQDVQKIKAIFLDFISKQ